MSSNSSPRIHVPPTGALGALGCAMLLAACAGEPRFYDESWVGTVTSSGDSTTVVNKSGSVWGGTAVLVEEATIGVDTGPDEYMLGDIAAVHADDARIYVVDPRVPAVRTYDHAGTFTGDIGARGEGPGEYTEPVLVAVATDGTTFVYDNGGRRVLRYARDGTALQTLRAPAPPFGCCGWPMLVAPDGHLWIPLVEPAYMREAGSTRFGTGVQGSDGPDGSVVWAPDLDSRTSTLSAGAGNIPFGPDVVWGIASAGSIVAGVSDRDRFEIYAADGSRLVVAPTDTVTFAAASAVVVLVATLAFFLPAHRAAAVDPVTALRRD